VRAAAVQLFATPFALERNLETAERLVRQAAAQGARVVVLPELFNTGYVYTPRLFEAAEGDDGPTLRWLTGLSAELKMVLGGAMLLRDGRRSFDTFVLAEPDGRLHRYRKQHPLLWEHCYFESGDSPCIAETSIGRIGLLIGWDAAFRSSWEAYRDRVDLVLAACAPPRFHRAVLNFPAARRVYLADLVPDWSRDRDAMDDWYLGGLARGAAFVRAPVVSAVTAGRFVSAVPFARLSFWIAGIRRPRHWRLGWQAARATLRATFYGCSGVFGAGGESLARAAEEEGLALADVGGGVAGRESLPEVQADRLQPGAYDFFFTNEPSQRPLSPWLLEVALKRLGGLYYRGRVR
jgi:predicted amidohydrolase